MASGESDWSQEVIAAAFCATKDGQNSNSEPPIEEVRVWSKYFIPFATVEKNVDFFFGDFGLSRLTQAYNSFNGLHSGGLNSGPLGLLP
jgi:hypothetical protein